MNDDELATAVKASVTDVHMTIPAEQIISRSRAIRNRHRIPGLAAGTAVVAAAVLAVTGLLPGHSATVQPGIHLSAWTVVKHPDGTVYVRINQLRDPAGLQRKLRADGVRPVSSSETCRMSSGSRVSGPTATTVGYCRRLSPQ